MSNEELKFGEDWFTKHLPLWNPLFEKVKPRRILEIGSYEGRATCWMIEKCSQYGSPTIYCVDTWQGGPEHHGRDFVDVERLFDNNTALVTKNVSCGVNLHKRKGFSEIELSRLIVNHEGEFDLIYIDGSHTAINAMLDAVLSFRLLRVGGVMIFDDYRAAHTTEQRFDFPMLGIDSFVLTHENKLKLLKFHIDNPYDNPNLVDANGDIKAETIYQLYIEKVSN